MIRGLEAARQRLGFEPSTPQPKDADTKFDGDPMLVPMMYRAQTEERCSLQFAGDRDANLKQWVEEWVDPLPDQNFQPRYQRSLPPMGWDGAVYRLKIKFSWRVCSNCGADSILRPVLGKDGIPFFPGSSIKGLFLRLANAKGVSSEKRQKIKDYCGSQDGKGKLRFHGAYPIGDWAGAEQITDSKNNSQETHYRMVDVVHPQQHRQVEGSDRSASAYTLISLYEPTLVFELSSAEPYDEAEWKKIGGLLRGAVRQGLGGKTSTGYGLWVIPKDRYALQFSLEGIGVSSLLRSNEPEFRSNMFKASLRGHAMRLLAGVVSNNNDVKRKVNQLFGHTKAPGQAELYWEWQPEHLKQGIQGQESTPIYRIKGTLYVDLDKKQVIEEEHQKCLRFLKLLVQFAYTMGGFGKSWRRVWHNGPSEWEDEFKSFLPSYKMRAIGCHWQYRAAEDLKQLSDRKSLTNFLQTVYQETQVFASVNNPQSLRNWRESWHPKRVAVFCSEPVSQSSVIQLFHQDDDHPFKNTPAICGKKRVTVRRNGREEEKLEFYFSSLWHRMLPIGNGKYLEIVTMFHGNSADWQCDGIDQRSDFVRSLQGRNLSLAWGTEP
ncbi:MAG: hypothetical protein F6K30_02595 [Cyanothece sp. SIO2G6]|nr:hypothetical protein [Cyanothece sp. SIO2G6]